MIHSKKDVKQPKHGFFAARFVQAHTQMAAAQNAQVDARRLRTFDDGRLGTADIQGKGVEEMLVKAFDALGLKARGEHDGQPVHALCNALQAFRAVVHRIEAGDVGQQYLGGADVGVGFFAADVLLAGLQGHSQCGIATGIT
ncbi:hypothetical protein D3C79_929820 [compost metagenome]